MNIGKELKDNFNTVVLNDLYMLLYTRLHNQRFSRRYYNSNDTIWEHVRDATLSTKILTI